MQHDEKASISLYREHGRYLHGRAVDGLVKAPDGVQTSSGYGKGKDACNWAVDEIWAPMVPVAPKLQCIQYVLARLGGILCILGTKKVFPSGKASKQRVMRDPGRKEASKQASNHASHTSIIIGSSIIIIVNAKPQFVSEGKEHEAANESSRVFQLDGIGHVPAAMLNEMSGAGTGHGHDIGETSFRSKVSRQGIPRA